MRTSEQPYHLQIANAVAANLPKLGGEITSVDAECNAYDHCISNTMGAERLWIGKAFELDVHHIAQKLREFGDFSNVTTYRTIISGEYAISAVK